ncbi:extracellular solute-binding protein [Amantichitinum ursilacus]|uniref:Putative sugar-binding periplasmic protein n=1 Tax=Amantichitinum ursilacus TaxID=857265 RepID=A0A0N1JS42_9NEIS|nr:extracellular solute-binding protein [Amantichitinum ursilacus]KPC50563.1 putative sugar-binding periplasmic protein precursor [Amantichitinum ursilacus]
MSIRNQIILLATLVNVIIAALAWVLISSTGAGSGATALIVIVALIVASGVIAAGLGVVLKPLFRMRAEFARLAASGGDLNVRLDGGSSAELSEIASAFNAFSASLQTTFREVQRDMETLSLGLKELGVVTTQLVKDAHTQSDFSAASAAAVEEITVSINHIADNARDVDDAVTSTQTLSEASAESVLRVSDEVSQMAKSMTELGTTMDALERNSQKIGSIVTVIKDVAGQTNLLALNAAIEAARAGEQGRGFAVVADEVRKLAERTAKATVEISQLIDSVALETRNAVSTMGATSSQVLGSVEKADAARASMLEISGRMQNMVQIVRGIADATMEQTSASTTMARTSEQINVMSQASDSALQQSRRALESLEKRAGELMRQVGRFRLEDIEVLHGWFASSGARAVAEIKMRLNQQGHHWADMHSGKDVPGMLKKRIEEGKLPTAAAFGGVKVQNWVGKGVLANLDPVAQEQGWSRILPAVLDRMMQAENHYVAVPLGVARVNVLWVNANLLKRVGVTRAPATWDEFFSVCDKLVSAGITPLAHSEVKWQVATLFEAVVLGLCGAEFYLSAFSRLDANALGGSQMAHALETFRRLKRYCTPDPVGREWNLATADVINGRAAMQLMGDWVKGELDEAGKQPGVDYMFWAAPTLNGEYSFAADTLTMFRQDDATRNQAQMDFARLLMSHEGQLAYNKHKGSIPARTDVDVNKLDAYGRDSAKDFNNAASRNTLVPSWAHNMAVQDDQKKALIEAVGEFWANDAMSGADGARRLAGAIRR